MRRFTFMWLIENYSCCWHETGEELVSPTFFTNIMMSTSWNLKIYPRGYTNSNFISLCLHRLDASGGPKSIAFNFELSILDADGKVVEFYEVEEDEFEFEMDESYEFIDFAERFGNILGNNTSDTLRVCCVMWVDEGSVENEDFSCGRTRIGLEKFSFINIFENFRKLQRNQKNSFKIQPASDGGMRFSGNIFVKHEPGSEDEVMLEIIPDSDNYRLIMCKIYFLSSDGKEVECGKIDTRDYTDSIDIFSFPINLEKNLLEKEKLALRWQCLLSTGIEFQRIDETFYDLHLTPSLKEKLNDSLFSLFQTEIKSVLEDFKNLYKDQILSDIQLKTMNKAYPAHKSVLCARSPVFRAMLTTNMKESLLDCIQVDDLEESTIDQFLLFLYCGNLEDLQWENAMKLYYAADKYQVQRLKDICTSFLITRLNIRNMSNLLILADRHEDSDLKTAIEKFIFKKNKEVFCTDEWEKFMEKDPILAMKTMHFYFKHCN